MTNIPGSETSEQQPLGSRRYKAFGWVEILFGTWMLLLPLIMRIRHGSTPDEPPNDNLFPALYIGFIAPAAVLLLFGGIAIIRRWRTLLLWQIFCIPGLALAGMFLLGLIMDLRP